MVDSPREAGVQTDRELHQHIRPARQAPNADLSVLSGRQLQLHRTDLAAAGPTVFAPRFADPTDWTRTPSRSSVAHPALNFLVLPGPTNRQMSQECGGLGLKDLGE